MKDYEWELANGLVARAPDATIKSAEDLPADWGKVGDGPMIDPRMELARKDAELAKLRTALEEITKNSLPLTVVHSLAVRALEQ